MKTGTIFNIQKLSIHDGPGIRSTVFFKGCPLSCTWCSNPESQNPGKEIACFPMRCVQCGYCSQMCPKGIIEEVMPFGITDRDQCDFCLICVKECCTNAKKLVGDDYTVEELLVEILKDKSFYDSSGGGVTFSGGEPLMQGDFLLEILKACKEEGVNTAIETTGFADLSVVEKVIDHLDLIFLDVKHMDDEQHKTLTGVSNKVILENLAAISKKHANIIVRIPVIPGLNDQVENITKTADYVAGLGIKKLEMLPYHNLGEVKYGQLGREYSLAEIKTPSEEEMNRLADEARAAVGERETIVEIVNSL